jgi:glycosyltransferase involved in cell wall biosynthesis
MTSPRISVVLPTLDCADELPAHIRSMESWLDLAGEIIAVDSDSADGTADVIREHLKHPNLRVLNHPRGLYQSWNHAISLTTGKWIYISTIRDTITRDQLMHLIDAGETLEADVVSSLPEFVFDAKINMTPPVWPISRILEFHQIKEPTVIHPMAAFCHACRFLPNAILGSSASNIYRGNHLRARPFPTSYRMAGDTGWAIRHALETRFCYTARIGSIFHFHSDTYSCPDDEANKWVCAALQDEGIRVLRENKMLANNDLFDILEDSLVLRQRHLLARAEWSQARREERIPWYLRLSAIMKRNRSKILRRKNLENMERLKYLESVLKKLPLYLSNQTNHSGA